MKIGIVNYSIGNVGSVYSALKFYGYDVLLVNRSDELENANIIVLAGVGNYATAVSRLKALRLWDKLNEEVLVKKKPILGICLGMQLFADVSYEDGESSGFGWIKGNVTKLKGEGLRVPHIGWNEIKVLDNTLFNGMKQKFLYFMHSYHFIPKDKGIVIATTDYGNEKIISALKKDNIVGVQFHPEKSQGAGLRFLRNMVEAMT